MLLTKSKNAKLLMGMLVFVVINFLIIAITLTVRTIHFKQSYTNASIFLLKTVYLDNFLKQSPLLLATLTLVGYLSLSRSLRDATLGALKTAIGVFLLTIGAGALIALAKPVFDTISGIKSGGIVPLDPYFGWTSASNFLQKAFGAGNNFLTLASFVFLFGFAINLIMVAIRKYTNTNSIMITAHVMLQQSTVLTALFYVILFGSIPLVDGEIALGSQIGLVIIAGFFIGIYWSVASTATLKITNIISKNGGFSIGHQQMLSLLIAYKVGRFFGQKANKAEDRKLPSYLKMFEDNIFTQSIIIFILFTILFIIIISYYGSSESILPSFAGFNIDSKVPTIVAIATAWNSSFAGANLVFIILGGSLKMVASLLAIITGVRMFVTELQQSFHGISEKIIPGAVVAVDVAAIYGFSINSVTYGFISGVIGQFLAVILSVVLTTIPGNNYSLVAMPLFISLFFNSGAQGVYANVAGGWKAAALVPGIIGFIEIIIISFALKLIENISGLGIPVGQSPVATGFLGMSDWNLFFGLILIVGQFHIGAAWAAVVFGIVALIILAQIVDSTTQSRLTWVQKQLKIKVKLI